MKFVLDASMTLAWYSKTRPTPNPIEFSLQHRMAAQLFPSPRRRGARLPLAGSGGKMENMLTSFRLRADRAFLRNTKGALAVDAGEAAEAHCSRPKRQRRVPKAMMQDGGSTLWTDLRVWAYPGEIILVSGRGSR